MTTRGDSRDYILVSTGKIAATNKYAATSEIIPLKKQSGKTCFFEEGKGLKIEQATGGFLPGFGPIICGRGYCADPRNSGKRSAIMISSRSGAASLIIGNSIWITGGWYKRTTYKSTEFVKPGSKTRKGPDLPKKLRVYKIRLFMV